MRRKIVGVISILFMALMVAAPLSALAAKDTIKIGVIEALSGPVKDIGERYLDGVTYAAKVINESGGLLGKKVEIVPVDSEFKADVAIRKALNLNLKQDVKFFCGGTGSAVGAAMQQLAQRQNAIFFTYGMLASSMTGEKCSKNFFRTVGNTDMHSYALAKAVVKKGYKKVGIIAQDYSFGKEAVAAFKKKLAELSPDTKVVVELYHPVGTKDFAPYISQFISVKPDAIFTPNFGNDLTMFIKQGRPMGMNQKLFAYYISDDVTIKSVGEDSFIIGDIGADFYALTIPTKKNEEFVTKFYKDRGYYPAWVRGAAYLSIMFWAEAVKKAGTTDVNAVIKTWEGLSYDGITGVMTMRPCDHQVQLPYCYTEIVEKSKYYNHAYIGTAVMISAKDVEVPCEETGCKMK